MSKKIFDVAELDRNLAVDTNLDRSNLRFLDVRENPFDLYGLYNPQIEAVFRRMPEDVAKATSPGVYALHHHTAGGRVRFCTDSPYIAIHAEMHYVSRMSHCALTGSAGFDLYIDDPQTKESRFYRPFLPPFDIGDRYEACVPAPAPGMHFYTVDFPTYSGVKELYIGLAAGAAVGGGLSYEDVKPIVYYGSSITQGGCASRPGTAYQAVITRHLHIDHINLGFSGSGKAELPIVNYMANLPMSVFVCDYDHNAPDPAYLEQTHERMYRVIREKNPDLPYIMVSRPDWGIEPAACSARRAVIYQTYRKAVSEGDENVYFVDGETFFQGVDRFDCTVDGCHPNDIGFLRMAEVLEGEIRTALRHRI